MKACLLVGIHGMSACHKYLDREDLWVRFAILFSLRVINQLHTHSGCSRRPKACTLAHSYPPTEMQPRACLMFSRKGEGTLQGLS